MMLESIRSMFGGEKEKPEPTKEEKLADLKARRDALLAWMKSPDKHRDDGNDMEKLNNEIEALESKKD